MGETAEDPQVTQDQHVAQIETLPSSTLYGFNDLGQFSEVRSVKRSGA
jgi:hypothetical protein